MKSVLKNMKVVAASPNENINVEFQIEEVSFEANLQEVTEMYKSCKELVSMMGDEISRFMKESHAYDMENTKLRTNEELKLYAGQKEIERNDHALRYPKEGK